MQHRIETTVELNGTIVLQGLPFREGEAVEIVIRPRAANGEAPVDNETMINLLNARIAGLHAGAMRMSADFDESLPDEFWLGGA